jgi:hypothetical protein
MRSTLAAILIAALALPAPAWETDVHYGLTKWLAVKAGFSLDEAEIIAEGAQDADEGSVLPAPGLVLVHMCLRHDVEASRLVQQHHFPSYAPIPEMPPARAVTAGDNAASRWTRMEMAVPPKGASHGVALFRFGSSLHPLEDSWSHAGVPDIAPACDKTLAWGHPKARGGALSHDADITYKHVEDTEETAHAVLDELVEFHKRIGDPGQSASWSALQPAVRQFAQAATKTDKLAWFKSDPAVPYSSYRKNCFLNGISIPDGPKYQCGPSLGAPSKAVLPQVPATRFNTLLSNSSPPLSEAALPQVASDAEKFVREFLYRWIVEQKVDAAVEQMDGRSLSVELGLPDTRNPMLLRNMLLVWLNPDHGIANETGHGTRTEFSSELRDRLEKNRMTFSDLSRAIRAPETDLLYLFTPVTRTEGVRAEYAATFQFLTAPRDVVSVGVAHYPSGWKVVSFTWVAF